MPDLTPAQIEYKKYLQSDHWRNKRQERLAFAGNRCELCNRQGLLDVYHRTYARKGLELLTDLIVLCRDCHTKFHEKAPQRRKGKKKRLSLAKQFPLDPAEKKRRRAALYPNAKRSRR